MTDLPKEDRDLIERVLGFEVDDLRDDSGFLVVNDAGFAELLAAARSEGPARAPVVDEAELLKTARGALNFILAFYDPNQRHLDTNAWKQAEMGGKLALIALSQRLDIPVDDWIIKSVPQEALAALGASQ